MVNYLTDKNIDDIFKQVFEFKQSKKLKEYLNLRENEFISQSSELWSGLEVHLKNVYDGLEDERFGYFYSKEKFSDTEEIKAFLWVFLFKKSEEVLQKRQSLEKYSDIKHIDKLLNSINIIEEKASKSTPIRIKFYHADILRLHRKIEDIRGTFHLLTTDKILELTKQELISFIKIYFSVKKSNDVDDDKILYYIDSENYLVCMPSKSDLYQICHMYSQCSVKDYYTFQRIEKKIWAEIFRKRGKEITEVEKILNEYNKVLDLPLKKIKAKLDVTYSFMIPIESEQKLLSILTSLNDSFDFLHPSNSPADLVDLLITNDYRTKPPIKFTKETSLIFYLLQKIQSSFNKAQFGNESIGRSKKFLIYPRYNSLLRKKINENKFVLLTSSNLRGYKNKHKKYINNDGTEESSNLNRIDEIFTRYLK